MIITDLSYQEIAVEANDLEGGLDLSANFTSFESKTSVLNSATQSGPGGSASISNGASQQIDTSGFAVIALGL